jgi:Glycosyl hydrolase family 63 C-terminal domain
MMFSMRFLLREAAKGDVKLQEFLKGDLYQRWQLWYDWFFRSQENPTIPFTFSWRGRTSKENMPSGLDDYPRAYIVNDGYEIHLDLQSWMVEFSTFMGEYSALVGNTTKSKRYHANAKRIKEEL